MIDFEPFFMTLKRQKMSQYKLINTYGISAATISSLKHNKSVSTNTIDDLCKILECDISDIMRYTP